MNAKEQMKRIVQERNWHNIIGDKKAQKAAAQDKLLIQKEKLSYEKCCEWLDRLGWKKLKEEEWIFKK